jgi:hypothetical protein
MKLDFHGTPLPSSGKSVPLYGGFPHLSGGGTPLLDPLTIAMEDTIIVRTDVIRQYQQIIFQLEQQVYEYRTLLNRVLHKESILTMETEALPSIPLNAASVEIVNSIAHTRIHNDSILRAFDDDEEA